MNTPQQIDAVKAIMKIKNSILHCSEWDDIASHLEKAIDISLPVPPNAAAETLDKTVTKQWNIIALKSMVTAVRERNFASLNDVYPAVTASLLRLAMVFVKGGLKDINKILANALLSNGGFQSLQTNPARRS